MGIFSGRGVPGTSTDLGPRAAFLSLALNANYHYQWVQMRWKPYVWLGPGLCAFIAIAPAPSAVEAAAANRNPILGKVSIGYSTGPRWAVTAGAGLELNERWGLNLGCQWLRSMGRSLTTLELGVTFRP